MRVNESHHRAKMVCFSIMNASYYLVRKPPEFPRNDSSRRDKMICKLCTGQRSLHHIVAKEHLPLLKHSKASHSQELVGHKGLHGFLYGEGGAEAHDDDEDDIHALVNHCPACKHTLSCDPETSSASPEIARCPVMYCLVTICHVGKMYPGLNY